MARRTTRRRAARPAGRRGYSGARARTGRSYRSVPQRRTTARRSTGGRAAGTVRIVIQQAAPAVAATTAAVSQTTLRKARW